MVKKILLSFLIILSVFAVNAQWSQLGLDIDGEAPEDHAASVSISSDGMTLAVGGWGNDGNGNKSGHVRVYNWNGSVWLQLGNDIDGEAPDDYSGLSVSIDSSGQTVAIGAFGNDGVNPFNSNVGHVRVYKYNGTIWSQQGQDIDGDNGLSYFGAAVSISSDGSIVAIGERGGNSVLDTGLVKVFKYNGSSWIQLGSDILGVGWFGNSISLSSDGLTVAAGAPGLHSVGGQVRIFKYNGTSWIQMGLDINGEAFADFFGKSLSMGSNGISIAIGANSNDGNGTNSGHVRVFEYNGSLWNQIGSDIDGEAAEDLFGDDVSISSDGLTFAAGANFNDGNGNKSGHVRVFKYNGSIWIQQGLDIDGEAAEDKSGRNVSISSDGFILAIGAPDNSENGFYSGHARIYSFTPIGIYETSSELEIKVVPNPTTSGQIIISLEEATSGNITIRNSLGQVVQTEKFTSSSELEVNLTPHAGIYFLQVEIDGELITKKIVKE